MSAIREMIVKLETENEIRWREHNDYFEQQAKKYEEMQKKLTELKEGSKEHIGGITKSLEQLVANKHTIEKALEQVDNPTGLPIPFEQHNDIIDLLSKITNFVNNASTLITKTTFSPDDICQDAVQATKSVESDLKDCVDEFVQAQTLYHQTESLKQLTDDDTILNLDGSMGEMMDEKVF